MPNSKAIRISAKDLGAMSLEDFCPRCFWLKRNAKLPWQIFPGIFNSIDKYSKNVVNAHIASTGELPPWLPWRGPVKSIDPPNWRKFQWTDPATGITLSGQADLILQDSTGFCHIPDLKTAKHTENADKLLPMYKVQLNGYAIIWESKGNKVGEFPLIYCEPLTDMENINDSVYWSNGFYMDFKTKIVAVNRDFAMVDDLLKKAKSILDGPLPASSSGCKDCEKLNRIAGMLVERNQRFGCKTECDGDPVYGCTPSCPDYTN